MPQYFSHIFLVCYHRSDEETPDFTSNVLSHHFILCYLNHLLAFSPLHHCILNLFHPITNQQQQGEQLLRHILDFERVECASLSLLVTSQTLMSHSSVSVVGNEDSGNDDTLSEV